MIKSCFSKRFMLKYCLDRHKTQEICDKAVDACLPTLKCVPDCFVTNKMLAKLDNVAFSNNKDLEDMDSDIIAFFNDSMIFVNIGLNNNIDFDDNNFDKDDPANIVPVRIIAWCDRFKQRKACRKRETIAQSWKSLLNLCS